MKKLIIAALTLLAACGEGDRAKRIEASYLVHCEEQVDGKGERWCYKDSMLPVDGTYKYAYDENSTWTVKYEDGHMRDIIVENNGEAGFYRMNLIAEGERLFMVYSYLPGDKDSSAICGYSVDKSNRLFDCGGVESQGKATGGFICPATLSEAVYIPGCSVREENSQ